MRGLRRMGTEGDTRGQTGDMTKTGKGQRASAERAKGLKECL